MYFPLKLQTITYSTLPLTPSNSSHGIRNIFLKIFNKSLCLRTPGKNLKNVGKRRIHFFLFQRIYPKNFFKTNTIYHNFVNLVRPYITFGYLLSSQRRKSTHSTKVSADFRYLLRLATHHFSLLIRSHASNIS